MQYLWRWALALMATCFFLNCTGQLVPEIPAKDLSRFPLKHLEVNSVDYYFVDEGEGDAIFFLHGFPDMAGSWDAAIAGLSGEYRCIAPFLRGYYPTGIPKDGDYAPKTIAEDIDQLARKLGIDRYTVVGQDWGASVTYALANLHPERVEKIATIAIPHPSFIKFTPTTLYRARHFLKFRKEEKSVAFTRKENYAYLDKLYQRWSPNWTNYTETAALIKRAFSLPGRLEAALGYYWTFNRNRGNKELSEFYGRLPEMPVLTIAGKEDGALQMSHFHRMKKQMETPFWLVFHDEAGHFLHSEAPEFFLETLKAFLE